ncbi:MAG: hypothetical protein Q9220_004316 [cf. Caloplaca sp. 1 TL-2023]
MANLFDLISACFGGPMDVKGKKQLPPAIMFRARSGMDVHHQPRLVRPMSYRAAAPESQPTIHPSHGQPSMKGTRPQHDRLDIGNSAACQNGSAVVHNPLDPSTFVVSSPGDISPMSLGSSPTMRGPTVILTQKSGPPADQDHLVSEPHDIAPEVDMAKQVTMRPFKAGKPSLMLQIPIAKSEPPVEVLWPSPESIADGDVVPAVLAQELQALSVTSADEGGPCSAAAAEVVALPPSQIHTTSIHDWAHEKHRDNLDLVAIPRPNAISNTGGAGLNESEEVPKSGN